MARNERKKTDITVPEPRHRVGPKGISSGISFRDLPPASLDEIKKICEHYQQKTAGTYKSLASRYVYQMATEIEHLVDALKEGGYVSEASLSTMDGRDFDAPVADAPRNARANKRPPAKSGTRANGGTVRGAEKRNAGSSCGNQRLRESRPRPRTASAAARKPRHESYERSTREFHFDYADEASVDSPPPRRTRHRSGSGRRRRDADSLSHLNLEDQNEEVLRWLKEEMKRSQQLITRTNHLHDAELVNAKKEVEKVKRAAKLLIKAVHKKGKNEAAKSRADAESERRRRLQSQKTIESLIQSHSAQIDQLQRGLRHGSRDVGSSRDRGKFYPSSGSWGDLLDDRLLDDRTEVSFCLSDASDLTSILDDLAQEAYQQSCC